MGYIEVRRVVSSNGPYKIGVVCVSAKSKRCVCRITLGKVRSEVPEFPVWNRMMSYSKNMYQMRKERHTLRLPDEADSLREVLRGFGSGWNARDKAKSKLIL